MTDEDSPTRHSPAPPFYSILISFLFFFTKTNLIIILFPDYLKIYFLLQVVTD